MNSVPRLLLGIICSLSIVFTWVIDLSAEVVKGEVKYAVPEAQLFSLRVNEGGILLISWDKTTKARNVKALEKIKPDDYLIVDFSRQGDQLLASAIDFPEAILPAGIAEASYAIVDALADNSAGGQSQTLIDPRPAKKYDAGHIPGAISIPLARIAKRTAGLLPADKSTLLVFYDDGVEVDVAVKAAELSSRNGYTKILVFREGVRGWVQSGRVLASSRTFIRKGKPILIDLRSPDKVHAGHIAGAVNYPLSDLAQMSAHLPKNRRSPIVVYGESDKDAYAGAAIIRKRGYKNITVLRGGLVEWLNSAEALASGPAADTIDYGSSSHSGGLSPNDFGNALNSPRMVEIVDVRSDAEYRNGHFDKKLHIPLKSIALRHKELDKHKYPVVFAANPEHAEMVFDFLVSKDYRASFLDGVVEFGKDGSYTVK